MLNGGTLLSILLANSFLLKETDTLLYVKVERSNFKRKKNNILIEYQLETDDCLNKIELEIGE